ncbi:hypothetical protein RQP46_010817 [Phenoliferia psychrophenolica]
MSSVDPHQPTESQPTLLATHDVVDTAPPRRGPPTEPTPTLPTELILHIIALSHSHDPVDLSTTLLTIASISRSWAGVALPLLIATPVLSCHTFSAYLSLRSNVELEAVDEIVYRAGVIKAAPWKPSEDDEFPTELIQSCPNLKTIEIVLGRGQTKDIVLQSFWGHAGITSLRISNVHRYTSSSLDRRPPHLSHLRLFPSLQSLTFIAAPDNAYSSGYFPLLILEVIGPASPNLSTLEMWGVDNHSEEMISIVRSLARTSIETLVLPPSHRHYLEDSEFRQQTLEALSSLPHLTDLAISSNYFDVSPDTPRSLPTNVRIVRIMEYGHKTVEEEWANFVEGL